MYLSSFPEHPAFEALLSGSPYVDLLDVLGEVGGCDLGRVHRWIGSIVRRVGDHSHSCGELDLMRATTTFAALEIDEMLTDGRVESTTSTGRGWAMAVATLEQRILEQIGIESELVGVLEDVFLRVDSSQGLRFHPAGCLSVWVEGSVAAGFVAARYGFEAIDLMPLLTQGRLRSSDRKTAVSRYLKSICNQDLLSHERGLRARRQLAALEPGNADHWLEVARYELICGRPAAAFDLAARLERIGHVGSAAMRRQAENALAVLN